MTTNNTATDTVSVTVSPAALVESLGIKDADLTAMQKQVENLRTLYDRAVAAYEQAQANGSDVQAKATALVEQLRSIGLNDAAIGLALRSQFTVSVATEKKASTIPSQKECRSIHGDSNAVYAAEVKRTLLDYIDSAKSGFTAQAAAMACFSKHNCKTTEITSLLEEMRTKGEVAFNGKKGRGSCWASLVYAPNLSAFAPATPEVPATEK